MKKIFFVLGSILLVAAGCTNQQSVSVNSNSTNTPSTPPIIKTHYVNSKLGVAMDIPASWQVDPRVSGQNTVIFKDTAERGTFSVNPINADLNTVKSSAIKNKNNDITGLKDIIIDGLPALSFEQTISTTGSNPQNIPPVLKAAVTVYNSKLFTFTGDLTSADILGSIKITR